MAIGAGLRYLFGLKPPKAAISAKLVIWMRDGGWVFNGLNWNGLIDGEDPLLWLPESLKYCLLELLL